MRGRWEVWGIAKVGRCGVQRCKGRIATARCCSNSRPFKLRLRMSPLPHLPTFAPSPPFPRSHLSRRFHVRTFPQVGPPWNPVLSDKPGPARRGLPSNPFSAMNPKKFLSVTVFSAAVLLTSCQTNTGSSTWEDSRVSVNFDNSAEFTDFKDDWTGTERGREDLEYVLRRAITETAAPRLKEGQRLTITFTDIDLAGDFLPSVSSGHNVRVVKSIYPPRMEFRYTLTDANGAVLKEGRERLLDMAFQFRTGGIDRDQALYYDKEVMRDWIRKTI